jgi:hypothetical protein
MEAEALELIATIKTLAEDPSKRAYLGRCCWDDAAVHANWDACRQRLEDIRDRIVDFELLVDANSWYSEGQREEVGL